MTPPESAAVESARVLREQKLYLESLLEISPTAIVTLGLNRKVTSWNLAAEELFGYTAAEAIGRNLEDLVANEEDLRAEYTAYFEELARGERFHAVTRRTRKDGTLVDVDVFAVSVTVEDEPTGYLVIYYDISALKACGKALPRPYRAASARHLHRRARRRPIDLYQPTSRRASRLLGGRVARRSRALPKAPPSRRSRPGPRRSRSGLRGG